MHKNVVKFAGIYLHVKENLRIHFLYLSFKIFLLRGLCGCGHFKTTNVLINVKEKGSIFKDVGNY